LASLNEQAVQDAVVHSVQQQQTEVQSVHHQNNDLTTFTVNPEGDPIVLTIQNLQPPQVSTAQQYNLDVESMINGFGPDTMAPQISEQIYTSSQHQEPWVEIVEQPKSNSLRFRYECEGKGAGALQGKSSTPEHKNFPKIKIHGFRGFATVVVSCVTHTNDPPKAHPHKLVSPASVNNGCKYGICTQKIDPETMEAEFQHLGIQCVKRKDIKSSLELRKDKKVDPFSCGWSHMETSQNIDLNAVKLCFHVWYDRNGEGKCTKPMKPVCSEVIYDAKAKKELQIIDISDNKCSVNGDKKIILLCEKVSRDDIEIWFSDSTGWEEKSNFSPQSVHKQYAITFNPPKYKDLNIKEKVRVQVELRKGKSIEGERSEPVDFYYLPLERNHQNLQGFSENQLKDEIKTEYAMSPDRNIQQLVGRPPIAMKSNPYSPKATSCYSPPMNSMEPKPSPYSQVQIGQEGNPVLMEKRCVGGVIGNSSTSLSNIEPSLQVFQQQIYQNNMATLAGQSINQENMAAMTVQSMNQDNIAAMTAVTMSPEQYVQYSPQQNEYTDYAGEYLPQTSEFGNPGAVYCMNNLSSDVNNLNLATSPSPPLQPLQGLAGLQGGRVDQSQRQEQQKGGKRSQNDAGLDSGKLVLPYQNAKSNSGQLTVKQGISRQQSSLHTPLNSENIIDGILNMDNNIAGGIVNNL